MPDRTARAGASALDGLLFSLPTVCYYMDHKWCGTDVVTAVQLCTAVVLIPVAEAAVWNHRQCSTLVRVLVGLLSH